MGAGRGAPPATLGQVVAVTILLHFAFVGMRVTVSLFALSLQATPFTVGVLMSLLAVVPMLFALSWGRYVDRVGVRVPMLAGAAVMLAAQLLAFAVPRIEALFAVCVLSGGGFMLFHICVNHAAGVLGRPQHRARNFSVLALAFSTSGVLGPTLSGFAIDWVGHRYTLLLQGGVLALALAVLLVRPIDTPRHDAPARAGEKKRLADLLRIPAMRRVFVVSALLSMAWDLFTFVMPIHGSRLGFPASTIGLILGAFAASVFAVRLVLPLLVHRLSEWTMLIGATAVTAAALAAIPLVQDVRLLMAIAFVLGLGLGGAQPMIMALLYDTAPPGRGGEAVGVRTLLLNVSQTGIPLLFGALGAALGMTPVFWTMAAALVAGGWYARRRGR